MVTEIEEAAQMIDMVAGQKKGVLTVIKSGIWPEIANQLEETQEEDQEVTIETGEGGQDPGQGVDLHQEVTAEIEREITELQEESGRGHSPWP